jgi:formate dehydrogenase iron-sulfur subunit
MDKNKQKGFLIDGTKCIGCRGCQVACKQWNNLPAEQTKFFGGPGYQNPQKLSSKTYTLIHYYEDMKNGKLDDWVFWKEQCQHCVDPACVAACPTTPTKARTKSKDGPVLWDEKICINCRSCVEECSYKQLIRRCNLCADRIAEGLEPACVKTCPTDAILFGERGKLIEIAEKRLKENPKGYHQHIYGKEEVGGTCVLNISSVPLEKLGYPEKLTTKSLGEFASVNQIPNLSPAVMGVGAVLGLTAFVNNRSKKVAEQEKNQEKQDLKN